SLNGLSTPDPQTTPQRAQMAAAIESRITGLKFGEEFHSRLIRTRFQTLKHFRPVSDETLGTRSASARLFDRAVVFESPDHDAPSTRILTPQFHPLSQTIHVLRMKTSWELDAQLLEQLRGRDVR